MTTTEEKLAAHRGRMQVTAAIPMTVEEILAGETQAGVPRPAFLRDHEDDGTVEVIDPQRGD